MCVWLIHSAVLLKPHGIVNQRYSKSPTYESESCKLSKMQTCFQMSNPITLVHMSGVHCTTVHTLHEVVLLRAFPDSSEYSRVLPLFQARVSRNKHKSSRMRLELLHVSTCCTSRAEMFPLFFVFAF